MGFTGSFERNSGLAGLFPFELGCGVGFT